MSSGSSRKESDDTADARPPVLLGNLEVLELLQGRVDKRKNNSHNHRDWIETQVVDYLQNNSATTRLGTSRNAHTLQTRLRQQKKMRTNNHGRTSAFDLTEAEALQIVNLVPTEPVEIHLLIEELHDRMTARQQQELLETIQSFTTTDAAKQEADTTK